MCVCVCALIRTYPQTRPVFYTDSCKLLLSALTSLKSWDILTYGLKAQLLQKICCVVFHKDYLQCFMSFITSVAIIYVYTMVIVGQLNTNNKPAKTQPQRKDARFHVTTSLRFIYVTLSIIHKDKSDCTHMNQSLRL